MHAGVNGLDGLFSVGCGDCGDDNGLQTRVLQHLIVVGVDCGALEVGASPRDLGGNVGCERSDQVGTGSAVGKVKGVACLITVNVCSGDGCAGMSLHPYGRDRSRRH